MNPTKTLPVYTVVLVLAICIFSLAVRAQAQTFTTLVNFNGTDGAGPGALIQAVDGNFYGITGKGGTSGKYGTVYKMTAGGSLTSLYSFRCNQTTCPEGAYPADGLIQGYDGNFYGVSAIYGAQDDGSVFKITPGGELTTLHSFSGRDGDGPTAALIQATNGSFYGTTNEGGMNFDGGTIFSITPEGKLTTLLNFNETDGAVPISSLLQGPDGNFYGTTYAGGVDGQGTIFKITPAGSLTTLHSFYPSFTAGNRPTAGLALGTDGSFYGTTHWGTTTKNGTGSGCGSVFKVTPSGAITTLHTFDRAIDGCNPSAPLIQATDGNFYGTTPETIFQITPTGTLTTLQTFNGTGTPPNYSGLLQATDGNFYGATASGGVNGDGTIFRLSMGLGPFVKTLPTSGKVGATVEILGTDLTGTTSVSFNNQVAAFTVVSASEITTKVPAGATAGTLKVATPNGTLLSNVPFRVTP